MCGRHIALRPLHSVVILCASLILLLGIAGCGEEDAIEDSTPANVGASDTGRTGTPQSTPDNEADGSPDTAAAMEEGQADMQWESPPEMQLEQGKDYKATIHTNKGDIVIDLFESEVPNTVNNFVFLAQQGYYKNVPFHRVISGFMIQTGDPTGTGAGGPGYRFEDEPVSRDYLQGTVAMANAGPNTNGSQFFIMHAANPLPKNYTIFGQVIEGQDVVDAIASVPVSAGARGERSVPNEEVFMESVDISVE